MEALARWHHPSQGMVPPLAFLSSVAQAQLWHKLTDTILHDSLSAMRDLEDAGIFVPQVSVNFAQSDLEHPQLVTRILWALDQFDLQPNRLSVEVLENVVVQDAQSPVRHRSILWPSLDVTLILMISAPRKIHSTPYAN